ncbi:MAG: DUF6886 family protein [Dehalococcoidia bacterium]
MRLYHFSEERDIAVFEPHRAATSNVDEELVWAIDEWHAAMYYFPRQCPRACFWPGPKTSEDDCERWFGGIDARMVIAVEAGWLERIRSTTLYRYSMPESTFRLTDATAGHWVSDERVEPLAVEPVGDLLAALTIAGAELRITPSLVELSRRVIASTLEFSGTRLHNAVGWERLATESRAWPSADRSG